MVETSAASPTGLIEKFFGQFGREQPDASETSGGDKFLFEDRIALIADLLALKHNHSDKPDVWARQVQTRLLQEPAFAPLADALNLHSKPPSMGQKRRSTRSEGDGSEFQSERKTEKDNEGFKSETIEEIIDAAIRLAERHPVAAFGRDVRTLISDQVETSVARSTPVRVIRWGTPILVALAIGGTIWGGMRINGIYEQLNKDTESVNNEVTSFHKDAQKALGDVNAAGQTAITTFQSRLDDEAKSKSGQFTSLVTAEINGLEIYFKAQKDEFLTAEQKTGSGILNGRVDEITKDWDGKQLAINNMFNNANKTIELDLANTPAQIKDINDRVDDLDRRVNGLKQLSDEARELRLSLDTASGGAHLTPYQLLGILRWKDFLAVFAIVLSIATAGSFVLIRLISPRHLVATGFVLLVCIIGAIVAVELFQIYRA